MKNSHFLFVGLGALSLLPFSHADQTLLSDNFSGTSLNTSLWTAITPFSDSSVAVANNNLILTNRGQVLSNQSFPTDIDLSLAFEFTGSEYDSFTIATRTNGTETNGSAEFDGAIFVKFRITSDPSDPAGTLDNITIEDENYPTGSATLAQGTFPLR